MKLARDPLRLTFEPLEVQLLTQLIDELRVVAGSDVSGMADDPVRQRLYPSAYTDDPDAEAEYRSLTEDALRGERLVRLTACEAELTAGPDGAAVALDDPDAARRWLQVLNDLRLALGTRLGVTEEPPTIDPTTPEAQPWLVYGWLTELQDAVVQAVMD